MRTQLTAAGLTCPPSYRPNGSTRCVYVVNNQTASATAAAAACGPNPLVDVQDLVQYTNLKLYLQVQGTPLASYWTQYNYNAGVLTPSSAIVGNASNFNGSSSGSMGQCVAIQQQGLFVLTPCSNTLPFICVGDTQGTAVEVYRCGDNWLKYYNTLILCSSNHTHRLHNCHAHYADLFLQ